MKYISKSAEETKEIARDLAKQFKDKVGIIGLSGELGAGKTIFTQGFAEGLGITEKVSSPTFTIIKQHQIPNSNRTLYHIDLYRLENQKDFYNLGLEELFLNKNSLILIEWVDKLPNDLFKEIIELKFRILEGNKRLIEIDSVDKTR